MSQVYVTIHIKATSLRVSQSYMRKGSIFSQTAPCWYSAIRAPPPPTNMSLRPESRDDSGPISNAGVSGIAVAVATAGSYLQSPNSSVIAGAIGTSGGGYMPSCGQV